VRVLWFSDPPFVASGYGVQTALFAPRLAGLGHDVAIAAKSGLAGALIRWAGLPLYPCGRDVHSRDVLAAHAAHAGADVLLTLCDGWIVEPRLLGRVPWVPWLPVDAAPLPRELRERLAAAHRVVAMSRFGERACREAGLDARYAPLGVDTALFTPGDQRASRERLGLPADRFVVGMVADNGDHDDHKAFVPQLAAFAAMQRAHRDALLYLHTNLGLDGRGLDLLAVCAALGLEVGRDVVVVGQYDRFLGLPRERMADVYRALDVLLAVSAWEGFGLPLVEAQACGVPVVAGEWTSMGELCWAGWTVPAAETEPRWYEWRGLCRYPRAAAILDALEQARRGRTGALRDQARAGALAYDADQVLGEHWLPILEDLAAEAAGAPADVRRGGRASTAPYPAADNLAAATPRTRDP
jgi:glycosyltransferase involved in cell wall biosynthesis